MVYVPVIRETAIIGIHKEVIDHIPYEAEHADKFNGNGDIGTLAVPKLYDDSS
jgi:hypothetical protein